MKRSLHLLLLFLTTVPGFAQYRTETILQEERFFINSATNVGGKTRIVIPVNLPANTVAWYYTYSAYRDKVASEAVIGRLSFAANLTSALSGVSFGSTELVHQLVKSLSAPPGGDVCDVYLMDRTGYDRFMEKDIFGQPTYSRPSSYLSASRENFVSGIVPVCASNLQNGELYLGIRNPDKFNGIHVLIAVEAVVADRPVQVSNSLYSNAQTTSSSAGLAGRWKDDNSTFNLNADGSMVIKFDNNATWYSGTWAMQAGRLYITVGTVSTTYQILLSGQNQFTYQDVKTGTSYTAQRFAE